MADTPKDSPQVRAYRDKLKTLEEKLAKLKSGALKAGQPEDPDKDTQQEAIDRTEAFIRELKKAIQDEKKGAA